MKSLLESFNLSTNAIEIYLEGFGKYPHTFGEIKKILPKLSEAELKRLKHREIKNFFSNLSIEIEKKKREKGPLFL